MRNIPRNLYRFQVTAFDAETTALIEQHRKRSLLRQRSTFTPLQDTLPEVIRQTIAMTSQRKAA